MEDGSSTASEEFISGQRSQDIQHISSPQDDLSISCSFSLDRNTHFLKTDNESVAGICNEKNVKIPSNEKCSLQNPTRVNGEVDPTVSSGKKDVAVEERAPGILCGNTIEDSNWEHCLISRPDTIIVSEVSVQEHSHKEENVITFFDNKKSNVFSEPGSENVCEKPFSETEITSKVTSAYNVTNAKEKETEECASGSNSPEHEHNSAEDKTTASPTEIYASGSNSPEHEHNSAEEKTTASPTEIYASGSNSPEHEHNSAEEKTTASPTEVYASGSNSPEHAHKSAEEKTTASPTEIYASGSNSPEHAHNSAEEKTTASPTEIYASGNNSPEHAHNSAEEKTTASLTEIYASGNIEDEIKPKKNSSLESVSLNDSKESEDNKNNITESTTPLQIENKYYSESSNSCVNSEEMEIKINIEKSCPDNVFMLTSERKVKQNILLKEKKSASKVEELCDEKDLEDTNSECSSEATNFQKQDHDTHISDLEPCTSSDERRYSHTATIYDLEPSTSSDEQKYSNMTDVETCRSSSANEQKYSHETYIPDAEPDEINNLDDTQIVAPLSENDKSKLLVYCEPLHDEEESMSSVESNICANDKGVDDGKQKNEDCLNYKVVKNENEIKGEEHVLSQQPGSLNENELNLSSGKTFDSITNKINERGKLLIKDTFESNPEHCENEPTLLSENTLTENPTCREVRDSEIGREHSKTSEKCVIDCELDKGFVIAISNTTINDKAGNNIKENLNEVSYEKDNSNNKSDEIKELTNEPTFMTKSKKRKPGSSPIYEKVKIAKLDTTASGVTKDTEGEKNLLSETLPISHIKNHKRKLISPVEYSIQQPTEECSYKEDSDVYKGFKKRILAQTSASDNISLTAENHHLASLNTCDKSKIASLKKKLLLDSKSVILSNRKEGNEPNAQLEYAQYLGLQPTVKFKCYKCGDSSFPSMPKLQEHQIICLKNVQAQQPLPKQNQSSLSDPSASTNFRITRKVYLCSACGTYYENWNLFLHMREVHNRHICLYCLSMFSQADKLATHLGNKHSLPESVFVSPEQFHAEFKGPCFLMCCKCEQMFSESNFHKHPCKDLPNGNVEELCASCGLKGSHTSTCKDNLCNNNLTFSKSITSVPQVNEKTKPISNIQCSLQEHSNPATKYLIPLKKVSEKKKTTKILPEIDNDPDVSQAKSRDLSDVEDDYDISNAASFCHVNIHEPTEKQTSVTSKVKTYAKGKSLNVVKKCVEDIKTTTTPSESSKQQKVEDNVSINNQPQQCKTNEINSQNLTQQDENEKNPSYPNESVQFESNNSSDGKISQILSENKEAKTLNDENDIVDSLTTEVNPRTSPTISLNSDVPLNSSLEVLSPPNGTIVANAKTPESQSLFCENENLKEESKFNLIIESESKTHFTTTGKHSNTSTDTKEKESQSDTSGSEDKTRDTNEIFTSSSDVSSDEIESEQSKCAKKTLLQASSEEDSSSSDKMSLVVDENDDKPNNTNEEKSTEKLLIISNKNHGEKWPTNLSGLKEMATVGTFSENQEKGILETDNLEIINEKLDLKFDNKQKSQENLSGAEEEKVEELSDNIQIAGEDTPLLELILEQSLDKMTTHDLLKESVKVSCISCVYCNHAKKIAVNAKQLSLHLLAEHRFSPVLYFDISEPVEVEGFVPKLKTAATELQNMFLNTDTYDSSNKDLSRPYDRTYECFHCHFLTTSHKELYLHNRKMHQKTILLCIMCKSNFYSYSELLCHLCPGIYLPDSNINFRCCLCAVDGLPSAFRLMVHLRKRHNACDVCLETTGDQQKLSNHVWKHKLHHLCYRCGIAYRNKPDITKHLFWKHGTESVLCKKCLQKKWPHVYHFCIPPNAFVCEECNVSFSKAVALKVHKRLHVGDIPYACEKCEERFISRSLLNKHMKKHEPVEFKENISNEKYLTKDMTPETVNNNEDDGKHKLLLNMDTTSDIIHENEDNTIKAKDTHDKEIISATKDVNTHAKPNEGDCILNNSNKSEGNDVCGKKTKVVDVYDLPPLNLSSDSDDSDGDIDHMTSTQIKESRSEETTVPASNDKINDETPFADENQTIQVVDGVWDNFNTFQLNMEKKENKILPEEESESYTHLETLSFILLDHNYCGPAPTINQTSEETVKDKPENVVADKVDVLHLSTTEAQDKQEDDKKNMDVDHNYCFNNSTSLELNDDKEKIISVVEPTAIPSKKKVKTMKKKQKRASSSSSDSSSNSDSTSCSCGTNCSCSSSSSSSSGSSSSPSSDSNSSSSESRRKQAARREKRKERSRNKKKKEESNTTAAEPVPSNSTVIGVPNADYALQGNVTLAQEETELPIRESDLDTDETETDEDFYDQHPQKLANKLLAEKRNQLLLLAAVAPVNNGTMASSSSTLNVLEQGTTSKKKVKSKRRKKSQYQDSAPSKMVDNSLKLDIPSTYYDSQTTIYSENNTMQATTLVASPLNTLPPNLSARKSQVPFSPSSATTTTPTLTYHSTGSGSETDSKRLSRRRRVPKRFYGDSSDEDEDSTLQPKWVKLTPSPLPSSSVGSYKNPVPEPQPVSSASQLRSEEEDDSESEREDNKKSINESSLSDSDKDNNGSDVDSDVGPSTAAQTCTAVAGDTVQQKSDNLYCYCQCPYDEVSEMIACDGKDCSIEWFHFECVGIMVPPKGKWFCPDCRKKQSSRSEYLLHT